VRNLPFLFILLLIPFPLAASACPVDSINSLDDIKVMIEKNNLTSPSTFLGCLPEEYREKYALVYQSHSPEKDDTDPIHPRIISFGKSAKFVFALTGKSTEEGGKHSHKVQILNFSKFPQEHYELDFSNRERLNHSLKDKNPAVCLSCHGSKLSGFMPIWQDYPFWPGIYGSLDDLFLLQKHENDERLKTRFDFEFFRRPIYLSTRVENGTLSKVGGFLGEHGDRENKSSSDEIHHYALEETRNYEEFLRLKQKAGIAPYGFLKPLISYQKAEGSEFNKLKHELRADQRPNLMLTDSIMLRAASTLIERLKNSEFETQVLDHLLKGCQSGNYEEVDLYYSLQKIFYENDDLKNQIINDLDLRLVKGDQTHGWQPGSYEMPFRNASVKTSVSHFMVQYVNSLLERFLDNSVFSDKAKAAYQKIYPGHLPDESILGKTNQTVTLDKKETRELCTSVMLWKKSLAPKCTVTGSFEIPPQVEKIRPVLEQLLSPVASSGTLNRSPQEHFQHYCASCHLPPGKNTPLPLDDLQKLKAYKDRNGKSVSERILLDMPPRTKTFLKETELWQRDAKSMIQSIL
jgi:hypothetical protein